MKTDSIFYRIFKEYPAAFFELLGQSAETAQLYEFASIEVKQTAFRIDGVFVSNTPKVPIQFVEVQFQEDNRFFERTISEIFLYLGQNESISEWRFVVLVGKQNMILSLPTKYQLLSPNISVFYLDQIENIDTKPLGVRIVDLVVCKPNQAKQKVPGLIKEAKSIADSSLQKVVIDLIDTIIMYKFENLSYRELEAMFGLSELKRTRVYQEGKEEGEQEGRKEEARSLILRLLGRRLGKLEQKTIARVERLSLQKLEELAEALLDFSKIEDLESWLG